VQGLGGFPFGPHCASYLQEFDFPLERLVLLLVARSMGNEIKLALPYCLFYYSVAILLVREVQLQVPADILEPVITPEYLIVEISRK
jgi:hypothetical protein